MCLRETNELVMIGPGVPGRSANSNWVADRRAIDGWGLIDEARASALESL